MRLSSNVSVCVYELHTQNHGGGGIIVSVPAVEACGTRHQALQDTPPPIPC